MRIELQSIKISDLIEGYVNDPDTGVKGYHGKLDIRPPYQREFRYDEKQQQAVIDTILKGFPLNIMYWSVDDDGKFEMIDGQQRTLSICGFYTHDFNIVDPNRGTLYFSFAVLMSILKQNILIPYVIILQLEVLQVLRIVLVGQAFQPIVAHYLLIVSYFCLYLLNLCIKKSICIILSNS